MGASRIRAKSCSELLHRSGHHRLLLTELAIPRSARAHSARAQPARAAGRASATLLITKTVMP
eukprot:scaffold100710_cov32-Tisochrysis_lutea.AAC.1